jgi:uncharacterized protein YcfL
MKTACTATLALVALMLGLPGAALAEGVGTHTVDTSHPRAKLVLASEAMLGQVVILDPKFRDVGRLTQTQVTVQNLTENRFTVEYKFDWEDADGFKIEGPSVWRTLTLTPHLVTNLGSTGKTPQAKKIIVTVRFPDHVFIEQDKQIAREQN